MMQQKRTISSSSSSRTRMTKIHQRSNIDERRNAAAKQNTTLSFKRVATTGKGHRKERKGRDHPLPPASATGGPKKFS